MVLRRLEDGESETSEHSANTLGKKTEIKKKRCQSQYERYDQENERNSSDAGEMSFVVMPR